MTNISQEFLDRIYELSQKKMQDKDLEQAKKCFSDYIAVAMGGMKSQKEKMFAYIQQEKGKYSIIGCSEKVPLNNAILINAYNAHVLELDDGHRYAMMHLAAPIFSSLISVGENMNASMHEIFNSAIIGYEAAVRLAGAIQPQHKKQGFHATGTCGTVGCTLAIAVLLKYSREEMMNAMCAAATSAAGLLETIMGQSQQKPYNVANAAVSGMNAAMFGRYFSGPSDVLGGDRGFLRNFSNEVNEEYLLRDNDDMLINGIYMKPYAACRHCHAPIEAAIKLNNDNHIKLGEIKDIIIETYGLAVYGHDHRNIENSNAAKMSIPYSVAVALIYKSAGMDMFTENMIQDSLVNGLMNKIQVREKKELSAQVPHKRSAIITVVYGDGTSESVKVDYPKGEPENPLEYDEILKKYMGLMKYSGKSEEMAIRVWNLIWKEESVKIGEILDNVNKQ